MPSADTNASRTAPTTTCADAVAGHAAAAERVGERRRGWPPEHGGGCASIFERPSVAISAPITATPKVPPTIRLIDSTPEAAPDLVRSTEFIAAVLIGDITSPMPMPIRTNPGSSRR